ncbi:unnamed protein product [Wuchereria bancrofti]|uniref:Uncharacterized protein n=1 Tax=Wuchereria bancrofti TaxID=6293 RepID=A0A3P7F0T0_WUCBA|nr:unnamed protein product [Wuchereria bancrofti]
MRQLYGIVLDNGIMAIKSVLVSVDHTFREINPWKLVIGTAVSVILLQRIRRIWRASEQPIHLRLLGKVFSIICSLPPIRKRLEKELGCTQKKIFREIHKCDNTGLFFFILPESGMDSVKIISIAGTFV